MEVWYWYGNCSDGGIVGQLKYYCGVIVGQKDYSKTKICLAVIFCVIIVTVLLIVLIKRSENFNPLLSHKMCPQVQSYFSIYSTNVLCELSRMNVGPHERYNGEKLDMS